MRLASAALTETVKARALALGFDAVAIGPAEPPEHGPALERWIEAGHAGGMGYLGRRLGSGSTRGECCRARPRWWRSR